MAYTLSLTNVQPGGIEGQVSYTISISPAIDENVYTNAIYRIHYATEPITSANAESIGIFFITSTGVDLILSDLTTYTKYYFIAQVQAESLNPMENEPLNIWSSTSSSFANPQPYTVTYNGNLATSGSVPVDNNGYNIDGSGTATVLGNTGTLAKTGYAFGGWNTAANGSGTTYQPTNTFTVTGNTTLYAVWSSTYTVTYNGNGNTAGTAPVDSSSPYASGATVTVAAVGTLARTGFSFLNWNTAANGSGSSYTAPQTFSISTNTTLYAQWRATVTYNAGLADSGNVPVDSNQYAPNASATVLGNTGIPTLTRSGYTFNGWNTQQNGSGTAYAVGSSLTVTGDITLYSAWTVSGGGGGGAGDPYITTVTGTSYKLPVMDGAIRFYQGTVDGKTLTINATLKTQGSQDLLAHNLRSVVEFSKTMGPKKTEAYMRNLCEKNETLCFFENFYIQHGEKALAVNVWDSKLKVFHYTGGFKTAAIDNGDKALSASGIYSKYTGSTLRIELNDTASISVSVYNSPMIRSGIFIEVPAMTEGNGVLVNVLSKADMTLRALDDTAAVAKRDTKDVVMKRELFADHDGTRVRNVLTTC